MLTQLSNKTAHVAGALYLMSLQVLGLLDLHHSLQKHIAPHVCGGVPIQPSTWRNQSRHPYQTGL